MNRASRLEKRPRNGNERAHFRHERIIPPSHLLPKSPELAASASRPLPTQGKGPGAPALRGGDAFRLTVAQLFLKQVQ